MCCNGDSLTSCLQVVLAVALATIGSLCLHSHITLQWLFADSTSALSR
jgi:hypothetical protein